MTYFLEGENDKMKFVVFTISRHHWVSIEEEIKNLIIYKKALFNSNTIEENELIKLLNPIINSNSIWKSHSLYLIAEFFYSKNEIQKSKEFFNQILNLEIANQEIQLEAQKRLNRDLSE